VITKFSSAVAGSGAVMTKAQILAARKAAEAKANVVEPVPAVLSDARDTQAILEAFVARHSDPNAPDYFYPSDFNISNMTEAVLLYAANGQIQYNTAGFEAVHAKLLERDENGRNYYEPRTRKRGEAPAKRIVYVEGMRAGAPPATSEPMSLEEAARIIPLDELRAHVRKGNAKTETEALAHASLRNREKAEAASNDREAAKKLPFSELERLVRSNYRVQRPQ
jgi:hypothetical protein